MTCQVATTSAGSTDLDILLERCCCFSSLADQEKMFSKIGSSSNIWTCEALYSSSSASLSFRRPWMESWKLHSSLNWANASAQYFQVWDSGYSGLKQKPRKRQDVIILVSKTPPVSLSYRMRRHIRAYEGGETPLHMWPYLALSHRHWSARNCTLIIVVKIC